MPSLCLSRSSFALLALLLLAVLPGRAHAARHLAVLVGANTGWKQDQALRHAEDDARRLGAVLTELGGFEARDILYLGNPTTEQLRAELDAVARRLEGSPEPALFVFYYSGHADERNLHLRGAPLSFEELYQRVRALPVAVKLGILDACRSGSIIEVKGGRPAAAFDVSVQDELALRGTVFLTSSGADELSQEARAISGSFFTHHLVSGLRGSADEDGDGRVSLDEAYQYASTRTLLDTAVTPAGAQRPAFRNELKGRGEVLLTRVQGPVARLVFPPDGRRCFVTDITERRLVAEVYPQQQRPVQLAAPLGAHLLKCVDASKYRVAALTLKGGETLDVSGLSFREAPLSDGVLKGGLGSQDPVEVLKRQGFTALRDGQPEEALRLFEHALRRDKRDRESFRGKAQSLLALSERAPSERERRELLDAAFRADPRIEEAPGFLVGEAPKPVPDAPSASPVPSPETPPDAPLAAVSGASLELQPNQRQESVLRDRHPRRYQGLGVGLALVDTSGLFTLSLEHVVARRFQVALKLSPASPAAGASVHWVPLDGHVSPFLGVAGTHALVLTDEGSRESTPMDAFERALSVEGGVQFITRSAQFDLGLGINRSWPLYTRPLVALVPILSARFFLGAFVAP